MERQATFVLTDVPRPLKRGFEVHTVNCKGFPSKETRSIALVGALFSKNNYVPNDHQANFVRG